MEIEERTTLDRDILNQEKHDEVIDPTSTGRPVCGQESTKRCVLTPKHVEEDQTGMGRPVLADQNEEHKIDFTRSCRRSRTSPSSRACKKGSKIILIEKHFMPNCSRITSTTHSAKISKAMIRELGNVELFRAVRNYTKSTNALTVFFIGNKELCTALADNA